MLMVIRDGTLFALEQLIEGNYDLAKCFRRVKDNIERESRVFLEVGSMQIRFQNLVTSTLDRLKNFPQSQKKLFQVPRTPT